jgi:hypothetical protein
MQDTDFNYEKVLLFLRYLPVEWFINWDCSHEFKNQTSTFRNVHLDTFEWTQKQYHAETLCVASLSMGAPDLNTPRSTHFITRAISQLPVIDMRRCRREEYESGARLIQPAGGTVGDRLQVCVYDYDNE